MHKANQEAAMRKTNIIDKQKAGEITHYEMKKKLLKIRTQ